MDLALATRRLRNAKWQPEQDLEESYQQFKDTQAITREVAKAPFPELALISLFLHAIEDSYSDFVTIIKSQLSNPNTPAAQKTFEYTFSRFRTECHRKQARNEESDLDTVTAIGKSERKAYDYCGRLHGRVCWVKYPELAPEGRRDHFQKEHEKKRGTVMN